MLRKQYCSGAVFDRIHALLSQLDQIVRTLFSSSVMSLCQVGKWTEQRGMNRLVPLPEHKEREEFFCSPFLWPVKQREAKREGRENREERCIWLRRCPPGRREEKERDALSRSWEWTYSSVSLLQSDRCFWNRSEWVDCVCWQMEWITSRSSKSTRLALSVAMMTLNFSSQSEAGHWIFPYASVKSIHT